MKKVLTANVGGFCFVVEEDAYAKLESYFSYFRASIDNKQEAAEIMEDIEARVAEIFHDNLKAPGQVVDMALVNKVIAMMGNPDGAPRFSEPKANNFEPSPAKTVKRLFRDPDSKMIGGVCSGLAAYFNVDMTLVRVIFLIALIFGTLSFWVYIIMWIAVPKAVTITDKLQMRGEPVTAENIRNFSRR